MGHRTSISDFEMNRAATVGPEAEGYDIEAQAEKSEKRAKKVEADSGDEPKTSTAKTKAK